ncbi:hypothetical protein DIPPA_11253 [Diplonema papillatum]|nr:hypothetical protein DIPPA_11253 [Diplonema papillatum]
MEVEATDPAKDSGTTASKIPKGKRAHTAASRVVDVVDLDSDSEEVEAVEPPAKKQKAAAHVSLRSEFAAAFKEDPSKVLELMGDSREESGT